MHLINNSKAAWITVGREWIKNEFVGKSEEKKINILVYISVVVKLYSYIKKQLF